MHASLTGVATGTHTALRGLAAALLLLTLQACGPLARLVDGSASRGSEVAASQEILTEEERLRRYALEEAESFLGARYAYGAKGPNTFDCSGFTSYVLARFDIALLGSSMSQAKQGRAIHPAEAQPGDIVYFQNSRGRVNHVALVVANSTDGLEVIHATTSRGVVRDNIDQSSYWAPRLAGARCVVDCRSGLASNL